MEGQWKVRPRERLRTGMLVTGREVREVRLRERLRTGMLGTCREV